MTTDSSDDCLHLSEQEDQENPPESGEMEIIEEVSIGTTEIVHSDDGGISHETEVETIPEDNEHDEDDGEDSQPESEGVLTLKETTEESDPASGNRRGNEIRYNSKERVRLILLYAEHPNNPRRIKKLFESEFQKKPPATRTITQLYKKFLETGSVQNNYQKTRTRKSRTDENVERVKQAFQKSPTKSIRTIARELKIPHTTVSRILQELKGKDGGQIRRSRILKIGVKKTEGGKVISGTELVSSVEEQLNVEAANATAATTATGIVSTVMNPAAVDVQQSLPHQQQNSLVTLQTQPFVATIRTTPSIFILETAPSREMLGSLFTCLDFACKKHSNQRRKDPEQTPYINHPIGMAIIFLFPAQAISLIMFFDYFFCIGVASILINEGGITDLDVLQAAILHDTLEDTETTVDELRSQFGEKVYFQLSCCWLLAQSIYLRFD